MVSEPPEIVSSIIGSEDLHQQSTEGDDSDIIPTKTRNDLGKMYWHWNYGSGAYTNSAGVPQLVI